MLVMAVAVNAHTFTILSEEGKTLYFNTYSSGRAELTYRGDSYASYPNPDDYYTGNITIPSVVEYNGNSLTVTRISANAFRDRSMLTGVTIPSTVTFIGDHAFDGCSNLSSITVPSSITSFGDYIWQNCTGLQTVNWPEITSIPRGAFYGCSLLTSFEIPSTVTHIYDYAFYGTGLTMMTIPQTVTDLWNNVFQNCEALVTVNWNAQNLHLHYYNGSYNSYISSSTNYIDASDYHPFDGCSNLRNIHIGNTVQSLPVYAFINLSKLKQITFGTSLTSIPYYCFYNCISLDSINITAPVTSLSEYSFANCDSLISVVIPNTVTTIYQYVFRNTHLTLITIPQSVTDMWNNVFQNCEALVTVNWNAQNLHLHYYNGSYNSYVNSSTSYVDASNYHPFDSCSNLKNINIGNTVQSLPVYAFINLPKLKQVSFGTSLTSIPYYCFYNCISLDSVNITAPVTSLGDYAFADCDSLISVVMPNTVTTINRFVFQNTRLTSITIPQSVTDMWNNVFQNCDSLTTVNWNAQNLHLHYYNGSYNSNFSNNTSYIDATNYHPFDSCSNLKNINIGNTVQSLPVYAFINLPKLKQVSFGTSLTSIPYYCFYNCISLDSVNITAPVTSLGDYAFADCDSLISVVMPNTVTTINRFVFQNTRLTSITIPQSVTDMWNNVFQNCDSLTTVNWNAQNLHLHYYNGSYNSNFSNNTSYIDATTYHPFDSSSNLINIHIGNSVQNLPAYAFVNLPKLKYVTFGSSLTSIPFCCFYNCINLDSVNITSPVTSLDDYAFADCNNLLSIVLPNTITTINRFVFQNTRLTAITIPQSLTDMWNNVFQNCDSLTTVNWNAQNLHLHYYNGSYNSNFSNNTSYIDAATYHPFESCSNLKEIHIGNTVQNLPAYAFVNLPGLQQVTFNATLSNIPYGCFYNCTGLDYISLPSSISSIGDYAFNGCTDFDTMQVDAVTPPTTYSNTFTNVPASTPILVHCESKTQYQNSNYWSYFSNFVGDGIIPETVTVSTCGSYTWNGTTYTTSGNYTRTVSNDSGCDSLITLILTINPLPTPTITGNTTLCQGESTTLTADGGNSYLWSNASASASISVSQSGTYTVTATNAQGCSAAADVTVTVNSLPSVSISGNNSFCQGDNTTLTATGASAYVWSNGSTDAAVTISYAGVYTVTGTSANGCVNFATVTISESPNYNIPLTQSICEGESYYFHGQNLTTAGTYTHTLQTVNGCDSVLTLTLTVNPLPTVAITGNTSICEGGSTTLTASGADTYNWSTGDNTASATVSAFGIYTVTGTSVEGCSNTSEVTVLVSQLPVITITGETDICAGESTTLTANGGETYLWSNGTTDATLTVSNAGTYQVIGYNEAGCNAMASTIVSIWQPATSEFSVECSDSCYTWNDQSYCTSGDYTQTLQTVHGCDSVVTLHLTITVGIEDHNLGASMTVYPNPTTGIVNVQCTMNNVQEETVDFLVYDAFGRLLRSTDGVETQNFASLQTDTHGSSVQTQIDLFRFAPGIYFVKAVANGKVVAVRKVVKR